MVEDNKENVVSPPKKAVFNAKNRKIVTYERDGKEETVTLRKINYGERNDVIRQAIGGKIKYIGNDKGVLEVDPFVMREYVLLKSIVEAPFPHAKIEDIRNLDPDLAEYLADKAEELNPFR